MRRDRHGRHRSRSHPRRRYAHRRRTLRGHRGRGLPSKCPQIAQKANSTLHPAMAWQGTSIGRCEGARRERAWPAVEPSVAVFIHEPTPGEAAGLTRCVEQSAVSAIEDVKPPGCGGVGNDRPSIGVAHGGPGWDDEGLRGYRAGVGACVPLDPNVWRRREGQPVGRAPASFGARPVDRSLRADRRFGPSIVISLGLDAEPDADGGTVGLAVGREPARRRWARRGLWLGPGREGLIGAGCHEEGQVDDSPHR